MLFVFPLLFSLFLASCFGRDIWLCSSPAAVDLTDLILHPEQWPNAFAAISTLSFYGQQFYPSQCPPSQCGPNTLGHFNESGAGVRLQTLGKRIAFETGVVKDWSCDAKGAVGAFNLTIQGLTGFGVSPSFVNMDEPLLSGRVAPCSQPDSVTVAAVVSWMQNAVASVPGIQIVEIEPYPFFSAQELVAWVDLLVSSNPPSLAGVHLDIDFNAVRNKKIKHPCNDIAQVRAAVTGHGLQFGVTVNDNGYFPTPTSDSEYAQDVKSNIAKYFSAGCLAAGDRVVFESWVANGIPANLPESDPTSHTGIVSQNLGI